MSGEVENADNEVLDLTRDDVGDALTDAMGKVLETVKATGEGFDQDDQIELNKAIARVQERIEIMSGGVPSRTPQEIFATFIDWLEPYPKITGEFLESGAKKAYELAEMVERIGVAVEDHMREERLLTQTAKRQLRDLKRTQKEEA